MSSQNSFNLPIRQSRTSHTSIVTQSVLDSSAVVFDGISNTLPYRARTIIIEALGRGAHPLDIENQFIKLTSQNWHQNLFYTLILAVVDKFKDLRALGIMDGIIGENMGISQPVNVLLRSTSSRILVDFEIKVSLRFPNFH